MFRFKYKASRRPAAQPRHTTNTTPLPAPAPVPFTPPGAQNTARAWFLAQAERFETEATETTARIRDLTNEHAEALAIAAAYRHAAAQYDPPQPPPLPEPAYDEPQPTPSTLDELWPFQWTPSPDITAAAPRPCGCDPARGHSCRSCDTLGEPLASGPAWRPPSIADAAGWRDPATMPPPYAAGTQEMRLANGEQR